MESAYGENIARGRGRGMMPGMCEANSKRRWVRGGVFWVMVVVAGLVAGSWVKSYWRVDLFSYTGSVRTHYCMNFRGRFIVCWFDRQQNRPVGFKHAVLSADGFVSPWRYGGFEYKTGFTLDPSTREILTPYWFLLLLCLTGAWWASRPWRKGRKERRGFEVVRGEGNAEARNPKSESGPKSE